MLAGSRQNDNLEAMARQLAEQQRMRRLDELKLPHSLPVVPHDLSGISAPMLAPTVPRVAQRPPPLRPIQDSTVTPAKHVGSVGNRDPRGLRSV